MSIISTTHGKPYYILAMAFLLCILGVLGLLGYLLHQVILTTTSAKSTAVVSYKLEVEYATNITETEEGTWKARAKCFRSEPVEFDTSENSSASSYSLYSTLKLAEVTCNSSSSSSSSSSGALNILAIGDSLTAGYYAYTAENGSTIVGYYPYATSLQRKFQLCSCCAQVNNRGAPGTTIATWISDFTLMTGLDVSTAAGVNYDSVIMLLGTNDLTQLTTPIEVLSRIQVMTFMVLSAYPNATLFLMSLPACRGSGAFWATFAGECETYQILFKAWSVEAMQLTPRIQFIDIGEEIPYTLANLDLFTDWVHYSKKGSERLATVIYRNVRQWYNSTYAGGSL